MTTTYNWKPAHKYIEEGRDVYICIEEEDGTRRVSIGDYCMEGECPNDPYCYGHYRQWYEQGKPVKVTHFRKFHPKRPIYPLPDLPTDPAA